MSINRSTAPKQNYLCQKKAGLRLARDQPVCPAGGLSFSFPFVLKNIPVCSQKSLKHTERHRHAAPHRQPRNRSSTRASVQAGPTPIHSATISAASSNASLFTSAAAQDAAAVSSHHRSASAAKARPPRRRRRSARARRPHACPACTGSQRERRHVALGPRAAHALQGAPRRRVGRRQPRADQPPAQRWAPAVSGSQALGRRVCQ